MKKRKRVTFSVPALVAAALDETVMLLNKEMQTEGITASDLAVAGIRLVLSGLRIGCRDEVLGGPGAAEDLRQRAIAREEVGHVGVPGEVPPLLQ